MGPDDTLGCGGNTTRVTRTPEPVDPNSVDGLIARLQALPADARKLRVYIVGQSDQLYKVNPAPGTGNPVREIRDPEPTGEA